MSYHGALLEKNGRQINPILRISQYSAPPLILEKIRSYGIADLRYWNVLDKDW